MTSYKVLLILLTVIMTVGAFSAYCGYSVQGIPQAVAIGEAPGILGVVSWVWETIKFMFLMVSFQVDGMPVFMAGGFMVASLMAIFLIVKLIRGSD